MFHHLHGTWLPDQHRFWLWAESASKPSRKGGRRNIPPHPFHAAPDTLRDWLRGPPHTAPLLPNPDQFPEHRATLWLPSTDKLPVPSPAVRDTGTLPLSDDTPTLKPWHVTGLLLPIPAALDLLLTHSDRRDHSPDLHAWRMAALLAMQMVAGQQVVPALHRDGFTLRACWHPRPAPAMRDTLARLARSLPPLCRAVTDDPTHAPHPRTLLDHFLTSAIDATIRDLPFLPAFDATTPGGAWLTALLEDDPIVPLKGPAADALFTAWREWMGETQVAGDDVFRITFRLEPPDQQHDPWTLDYLLQATDDPSLLVPASHIWRERGHTFTYLERRFERPQERLLRGLGYAARLFPPLAASLRTSSPDCARLSVQDAFTFLKEAVPMLEQSGFGVLVPAWWQGGGTRLRARAHATSGPSKTNQQAALSMDKLINFQWHLAVGDEPLDLAEFEQLVALKQPLVQVRGQWVTLDPDQVPDILRFFQQHEGELRYAEVLRMGLSGLGAELPAGVEGGDIDAAGWLGDVLKGLRETQQLDMLDPPPALHATLRPYQQRGFSWLAFMRRFGMGACLADDMGLGKTMQTIALLLHERQHLGVTAPALIVCPTSVIGNWHRELERFAPTLRVLPHQGTTRQQGPAFHDALPDYDVVLTSYPLLTRDQETLTRVDWATVVLDEAQNIKNHAAKQARAARALPAATRLALTGTPVENRLSELWSIFAFLNPGYLGPEKHFQRTYARPIERTGDPQATAQLKQLTAPFILRRLKTDKTIIDDLPDKIEAKVYCSLSTEQVTLYEATVREGFAQVKDAEQAGEAMKRRGAVLAMLMKLKQICNHPAQFLKDGSDLPDRSGKLDRLIEMLEEVYETEDRALIFTQFSEMGELLHRALTDRFFEEVLFLHGDTPTKRRNEMVRQFQAPRGPTVFILSLKAGGTGLNLTRANHVFHFDRWWNPAVENQATDRAFRIGQTRAVQVHTFICGGTLEEHIDALIEQKRGLAESVLGTGEGWLTELSTDQLRDLVTLKH